MKEHPTGIDIFCGCGGFTLGSIQAGFDVVCGIDWSPDPLLTYWCNLAAPDAEWKGRPSERWIKRNCKGPSGEPMEFPPRKELRRKVSWRRTVKLVIMDDVRKLSGYDILEWCGLEEVDYVIGSPPCVSFSRLSKNQKREVPEDYLAFEFARLVLEMQPKAICMENVPQFATKRLPDGRKIVDVFTHILKNEDWGEYYRLTTDWQLRLEGELKGPTP